MRTSFQPVRTVGEPRRSPPSVPLR
jgi:hypothetical protein